MDDRINFPLLEHFPRLPTKSELFPIAESSSSTSSYEFDENTQFILRGCLYLLNLVYPRPERGVNGFRSDVLIQLLTKTSRASNREEIKVAVSAVIDSHISIIKDRFVQLTQQNSDPLVILKAYGTEWRSYRLARLAFELCLYNLFKETHLESSSSSISNTSSIEKNTKAKIAGFCYDRWKKVIVDPMRNVFQTAIHNLVEKYRNDTLHQVPDPDDTTTIRSVVNSYIELSVTKDGKKTDDSAYVMDWEMPFLQKTKEYYENLVSGFISTHSIPDFLGLCSRLLDLETQISNTILDPQSVPAHSQLINETVVIAHSARLKDAIAGFVENTDVKNLEVLYRLFERIEELDAMMVIFIDFCAFEYDRIFSIVKSECEALPDAEARASIHLKYCTSFLNTYYMLLDIIRDAFANNIRFSTSLSKISRDKFNNNVLCPQDDPTESVALFVSRYSDHIATSKLDYQQLLDDRMMIEGVLALFNFTASKDVFCKRYKLFMMNRLLRGLNVNRDVETALIGRLRSNYDTQFAQQLTIMMKDIDQSKERYAPQEGAFLIPILPTILTGSSWPINPAERNMTLKVPDPMHSVIVNYENYFRTLTDGKEIDWLMERSCADIELRTERPFQITMNFLQASVIITIYNAGKNLPTTDTLGKILELEVGWVEAACNSLKGVKIIEQNGKTLQWRINPKFSAPKIVLNASVRFVRPVKEQEVDANIEEERELKTQAAIVRIMKARRVLDHLLLIEETTKQTSRFFPQNADRIRRQVEKLINGSEKFIERIDAKTYRYVTGDN